MFDAPCYAVIFVNQRSGSADADYQAMAGEMDALAAQQPGFIGVHSVRGADGQGITVSYWKTLDHINAWKQVARHRAAQKLGRSAFYDWYETYVTKVERAYGFERGPSKI